MPRLPVIEPDQAQGAVRETYDQLESQMGKVINLFKGMANSPATLKAYLTLRQIMKSGSLSDQDREVIYLTASQSNDCDYCLAAHSGLARKLGIAEDQVLAIRRGEPRDPRHAALARFTRRVIETKGFVSDEDLGAVREAGYSDAQIAEVPAMIGMATISNLFNHIHETPLDFPAAPKLEEVRGGA